MLLSPRAWRVKINVTRKHAEAYHGTKGGGGGREVQNENLRVLIAKYTAEKYTANLKAAHNPCPHFSNEKQTV